MPIQPDPSGLFMGLERAKETLGELVGAKSR